MLLGFENGCNDPALHSAKCPHCGAIGQFSRHGSYERWFLNDPENLAKNKKIKIERVICKSCKKTHAIMPSEVVAYSPFSLKMHLSILFQAINSRLGVDAICARFSLSRRTYYRLKAHAIQLRDSLMQIDSEKNCSKPSASTEPLPRIPDFSRFRILFVEGWFIYDVGTPYISVLKCHGHPPST